MSKFAGFTDSERQALEYGFSSPHGAWAAPVRKMGGAFKRVIVRLQARELLTESTPYKVTRAGLAALVAIREQRDADSGCMAYQVAAQEARAALRAVDAATRHALPKLAVRMGGVQLFVGSTERAAQNWIADHAEGYARVFPASEGYSALFVYPTYAAQRAAGIAAL